MMMTRNVFPLSLIRLMAEIDNRKESTIQVIKMASVWMGGAGFVVERSRGIHLL
jgi:hypothetical protein